MRLTLESLQVLDAIDREGSFAAAADKLHRVPSAVTYAVQKLEQDLDVEVFDRSGHRARLTAAGRKLLEEGRYLLRAAGELECLVKRVATGWETELRIAVDDILPIDRLFPLVEHFYSTHPGTRIRLSTEVFGGTWDALVSGRADMVVGAPGDGPSGGGYSTRHLGAVEMVFVCAPEHPLAQAPEPIGDEAIQCHRTVAVADSSRVLSPRTAGLLDGQDVFTVPSCALKIEAHRRGMGVGQIPRYMVDADLRTGKLVEKRIENLMLPPRLNVAWRSDAGGKALQWFLERLEDPTLFADILLE